MKKSKIALLLFSAFFVYWAYGVYDLHYHVSMHPFYSFKIGEVPVRIHREYIEAKIDNLKEEGKSFRSIAIKYEWPSMKPLGQHWMEPFGTFYTIVEQAEINLEYYKEWLGFDPSDAETDEATGLLKTTSMRPVMYRKVPSRFSFGKIDALYRINPSGIYDIYFSYGPDGDLSRIIACERGAPRYISKDDPNRWQNCQFQTTKGGLLISFGFNKDKYMKHWKGIERDIFRIVNLDESVKTNPYR